LIDLVIDPSVSVAAGAAQYTAHPGGSPFNVAIGLARLGQPTQLMARLGRDAFGRQLRTHATSNGVDLSLAVDAPEPTTLAVVGLDEARNAVYDFYLNGTADWQWTDSELARVPAEAGWLHTGSLASWTAPGAERIEATLAAVRRRGSVVISYDPNIRPDLMPDHDEAVAAVERLVALAHVVKVSAEDLGWLYPGREAGAVVGDWRLQGPSVVVVTDGGRGAYAAGTSGDPVSVPAYAVQIVDTVGAGDAFMAGLINASIRSNLLNGEIGANVLRPVVAEAGLVAALTCARAGANPPTAVELSAASPGGLTETGRSAEPW
jgi:fructokinase